MWMNSMNVQDKKQDKFGRKIKKIIESIGAKVNYQCQWKLAINWKHFFHLFSPGLLIIDLMPTNHKR